MELSYECPKCKRKWDGGLHNDKCHFCHTKARITWTDESNDPPDGYCYPEDDEDYYEEEENE